MNRSEITKKVGQEVGNPALAKEAIDAFVNEASRALATGERVHISGLGSFTSRKVPRRRTRNPRTGEKVWAKTTGRVKFSPASTLVDSIVKKQRLPKQTKDSATTNASTAAAPAKKSAAKKAPAPAAPAKKAAAAKKTTAKSQTGRASGTPGTAKKAPARKTPAKKTTAKKAAAKKK